MAAPGAESGQPGASARLSNSANPKATAHKNLNILRGIIVWDNNRWPTGCQICVEAAGRTGPRSAAVEANPHGVQDRVGHMLQRLTAESAVAFLESHRVHRAHLERERD